MTHSTLNRLTRLHCYLFPYMFVTQALYIYSSIVSVSWCQHECKSSDTKPPLWWHTACTQQQIKIEVCLHRMNGSMQKVNHQEGSEYIFDSKLNCVVNCAKSVSIALTELHKLWLCANWFPIPPILQFVTGWQNGQCWKHFPEKQVTSCLCTLTRDGRMHFNMTTRFSFI